MQVISASSPDRILSCFGQETTGRTPLVELETTLVSKICRAKRVSVEKSLEPVRWNVAAQRNWLKSLLTSVELQAEKLVVFGMLFSVVG